MVKLLTLENKPIKTDGTSSNPINVRTNRKITKIKDYDVLEIEDIFVCGKKGTKDLDEFLENNEISKPSKPVRGLIRQEGKSELITSAMKKVYTLPSDNEEEENCELDTAGTTLFIPSSDDVEDVPENIIEKMCPFELTNLTGKAKIIRILDGDTIELLFFIKIKELLGLREKGRAKGRGLNKHRDLKVAALSKHTNAGFFATFSCRFSGIDAAEHDTIPGMLNSLLLEDYFNSLNNIIYIKIIKFDKYGRMLANLYSDKNYNNLINTKLVGVEVDELPEIYKENGISYDKEKLNKNDLKILALEYEGDAKDERFTHLPNKLPKGLINRSHHAHLLEKYKIQ